jgi:hypothetical protein
MATPYDLSDLGATEVHDLSDLGGAPITESQPQGNPSLPLRLTGDAAAGIASAGQGVHNFLSDALRPILGKHTPDRTNIDFSKLFGVNAPNTADTMLQQASGYSTLGPLADVAEAPIGYAWAANMAKQALPGAVYGATQSDDPVSGAATGAVVNAGLSGAGSAIGSAWQGGKNYLSKFAAQGLSKNLGEGLSGAKTVTNKQAFDLAAQNHQQITEEEKQSWNKVTDLAKQADEAGHSFDNQGYIDSLGKKLGDVQAQSARQSGFARANDNATDLLQGYIKDEHGTFTDAIEHNKALNKDFQNEITPGKSLPFGIVNYAKRNLNKTLVNNIQDNKLASTLGDALNGANKLTSEKNKLFNQVINPSGNQQISTFSKYLKGGNEFQDPTTFVKDYIPTSRGDGVQKMQQFSKMLGDEGQAKNIIKMNYFDKALENDSVNAKSFISKYNNLSGDQQAYLFNPSENKSIQALSKILAKNPSALDNNSLGALSHVLSTSLLGAGAGAGIGHAVGDPVLGTLIGGVAPSVTKAALSKVYEIPSLQRSAVNQLTSSQQPRSASLLSQALNQLLRATVTPAAVSGTNTMRSQ